jgi:TPR repeat protein
MRCVLAAVAWASLCTGADFQTGERAYDKRNYAVALREWRALAEQGHAEAQRKLGDMYHDAKGVPADDAQALRWYRLAAGQGDLKARFKIVDLCTRRKTDNLVEPCVGVDRAEGSEYTQIYGGIRTLAEKGDAEAQFMVWGILQSRILLSPDPKDRAWTSPERREAEKWLLDAAKQGYVEARLVLVAGCALWNDTPPRAATTLRETEEQVRDRERFKADFYSDRDCQEAVESEARNIDDLRPKDQMMVAYSLQVGPHKDPARAANFLEKAAQRGLIEAEEELGRLFYEGIHLPKDYGKASEWYQKYLQSVRVSTRSFYRVREASERLGYLCSGVAGIPPDDQQAVKWLLRAAEMGSAYAQRSIAFRYRDGNGAAKSLPEMARWFRRAAEQGEVESQFMLGAALYVGMGVPQDYIHAHMWLNLAAASGNSEAAVGRDGVAKYMSPEQIGEAQALAANWRPRPDPGEIAGTQDAQ